MNVHPENFPAELRYQNKWLVWSPKAKTDGTFTKIPLNPRRFNSQGHGKKAMSNNPATWGTLELALQVYEKYRDVIQPETGKALAGVGYVNQGDFLAIDLDDCLVDGQPSPEVAELVEELNSYTNITPSGNGLRILLKIPEGLKVNTAKEKINFRGLKKAEAWTQGKFTTMTGVLFAPHLNEIRQNDGAVRAFLAGIQNEPAQPQTETSSGGILASRGGSREWTEQEVREMLTHVSADIPNNDWVQVGMALKTWDPGERGRALFLNWSATAPNRFDGRDASTRWDSFSPEGNGTGRVTLGTLVHKAKEGGFQIGPATPTPKAGVNGKTPQGGNTEADIEKDVDAWESRLIHWKDLDSIPPAEPILDGWYYSSCVTLVTGEQGTFKSLISLAHSALITKGGTWLGLCEVKKTGPVLYVYLESPGGAGKRAKGVMYAEGLKDAPEVLFDIVPANLFDPAVVERFVRLVKRRKFVLVIIDVALSVFGAFARSTTDDMGTFMASCRAVATNTGAGVSVIHHPPKNNAEGSHGGMEAFALCDVWWVGKKKDGKVVYENPKQKEGEPVKLKPLQTRKHEPGGLVVGGLVSVVLAEQQQGGPSEPTPNDMAFLKALKRVTDADEGPVEAGPWKEVAVEQYKMKEGSFGLSRVHLIELGLVAQTSHGKGRPRYQVTTNGIMELAGKKPLSDKPPF